MKRNVGTFKIYRVRIVVQITSARKLGTRLNEHRKSVQACDLKSAVSEHAKDTDHCHPTKAEKGLQTSDFRFQASDFRLQFCVQPFRSYNPQSR